MVLRPTVLLSLEQSTVRLTVSVSDCDQGHHDGKTEGGRGQTREGNANMRLVEHTRKSDVLPSIRRMSRRSDIRSLDENSDTKAYQAYQESWCALLSLASGAIANERFAHTQVPQHVSLWHHSFLYRCFSRCSNLLCLHYGRHQPGVTGVVTQGRCDKGSGKLSGVKP